MAALPRQARLPSNLVFRGAPGGGNVPPNGPIDIEGEVVHDAEEVGPSSALGIVGKLWNIGNGWLRVAIAIIAFWPILITVAALIGWPFLTGIVTLLPLVAVILGLLTVFDPLVLAAIGTFGTGRKVLMVLAMIVGSELAVGVFFSAVPVANDRGLIPLALITMLAIVFFVLSGMKGKMVSVLVLVLVGIAAVMFMGGRDEIKKAASASGTATASVTLQVLNVGPDEEEVKIPLMQAVKFMPDKNIIIRRPDNVFFLKTPADELYQYNKKTGKYDERVTNFGYNLSKVYIRSAQGVARVEVSFALGDFKPVTPPAPPVSVPTPPAGATPLLPAKPVTPGSVMA